jgi:hypothetical protein
MDWFEHLTITLENNGKMLLTAPVVDVGKVCAMGFDEEFELIEGPLHLYVITQTRTQGHIQCRQSSFSLPVVAKRPVIRGNSDAAPFVGHNWSWKEKGADKGRHVPTAGLCSSGTPLPGSWFSSKRTVRSF